MTHINSTPPSNFEAYWADVQAELDLYPPAPELIHLPMQSNDHCDVYAARLTSSGPYRVFGYFSLPKGDGPFPTVLQTPRYGSVVKVPSYEWRQRYAVLSLVHRGQRHADSPYAAAYPGLLTDGVDDPATYVYRGIVADCLRAADFLRQRREVDPRHITYVGDDLAFITAALRPDVDSVISAPALFYNIAARAPQTSSYPLEEFNDYARAYPDRAPAMWRTLALFDPQHFAPRVTAARLIVSGADVTPLSGASGETYQPTGSLYRDGTFTETWLARRHGFEQPILPGHWQA